MDPQQTEKHPIIPPRRSTWWCYLLLAVFCYVFLKYATPSIFSGPQYEQLLSFFEITAPILAILFLLMAAHSLYNDAPTTGSSPNSTSQTTTEDEDQSPSP